MIKSNIKALMKDKKITYMQLEQATGLSSQTITRARNDQIVECRLSTLEKIANTLQCQVKDLFSEES